ncbi:hypothetical protein [uncultured Gammaproteobacteria bacterium]|nr:hypothetical protein [uncultured Gammaproteobacteria bacterium]CAC9494050.1 hypothetical protein [uncultured Gammaproteobacteria bacterium]CAC9513896.1 hypothetical protein [uncultured Gammaproteobacteria bacterium]CAC9521075.1 hypothetical protein [uncultured Gammaproteobacteria bacterium]CAC9521540.1 hypothetical protein [uncultured Gammaproteobacteria bacterium]
MESDRPQKISIDHDDYHAEHIGRTKKGEQFFLTTPFEPAINEKEGCEYIAVRFHHVIPYFQKPHSETYQAF